MSVFTKERLERMLSGDFGCITREDMAIAIEELLCLRASDRVLRGQLAAAEERLEVASKDFIEETMARSDVSVRLAEAEERLSLMGCGHPQCVVVTSGEGTSYCEMCRLEANVEFLRRYVADARRLLGIEVEP